MRKVVEKAEARFCTSFKEGDIKLFTHYHHHAKKLDLGIVKKREMCKFFDKMITQATLNFDDNWKIASHHVDVVG